MAAAFGLHRHSFTLVESWKEISSQFVSHPSLLVRCFSVHRIAAVVGLVLISYESFERMKVAVQALIMNGCMFWIFFCSFWVYVLDEGSYFPFCSCNNWMLNLYLQLFLGLLWPFSYPVWILLLAYVRGQFYACFLPEVGTVQISLSLVFNTKKISLHAQVQFHAKYPLFDSQSDREFTFSYAILRNSQQRFVWPSVRRISFLILGMKGLKMRLTQAWDKEKPWVPDEKFEPVTLRTTIPIECSTTEPTGNHTLVLGSYVTRVVRIARPATRQSKTVPGTAEHFSKCGAY